MIKNRLMGFTLIEMAATLFIAAAFSIGLYSVFLSANKTVGKNEVLYDVKSYAAEVLDIISEKMRNADQIVIKTDAGSTTIVITNQYSTGDEEFRYTVINNLVYENGRPMKQFGHHLIEDQELYEIDLILSCGEEVVGFGESLDQDIIENIYDLGITINIQSKINSSYAIEHKTSNRIFSINKFSQMNNI